MSTVRFVVSTAPTVATLQLSSKSGAASTSVVSKTSLIAASPKSSSSSVMSAQEEQQKYHTLPKGEEGQFCVSAFARRSDWQAISSRQY